MLINLLLALAVIIPVAMSTVMIVALRTERIAEPEKIDQFGLQQVRKKEASDFGVLAAAIGFLVAVAYILLVQRWPLVNSLITGSGMAFAILLSLAAAFLRPRAGLAGVPEIAALNLIWGAGYGWLLPLVIRNFGNLAAS